MTLRLSRDQRRRLFDREPVRISGIGECPVKAGEIVNLSSRVSLRIVGVRHKTNRWILRYELHDRRDPARLLRRVPTVDFDSWREADQYGDPREATPKALRDAAEESAYTSVPGSLSDAGEAVSQDVQREFSREAQMHDELREKRRREQWELRSLDVKLKEMRAEAERRNVDLSRQEARLHDAIRAMERRLKSDRRAA